MKLSKYFTARQTEEIILKIKRKYEGAGIRESLAKDPNKRTLARVIEAILLTHNGLALNELRQGTHLQDLKTFCLGFVQKFIRHPEDGSFKSIEPFFSLLLNLLVIHDMTPQSDPTAPRDHVLAEFLVFFFKSAIDRSLCYLTAHDVRHSLAIVRSTLERHGVHQRDKDELLEVMEVLSLFSVALQRQNHHLYELMLNSNGNSRIAEQSTLVTGASNASQLNLSILGQMNKNLLDLGLTDVFEEGLLFLVALESSISAAHYHDSSATSRLLNGLVRYSHLLPKADESVSQVIGFKLRTIELLVKGAGANEIIKQTLQGTIHQVMKCLERG